MSALVHTLLVAGALAMLPSVGTELPRARRAAAIGDGALERASGAYMPGAYMLDVRRSVVRWKGTKFRGRGKHEGTVGLQAGTLSLCGTAVCRGSFTLDMRSIAVTDIPVDDPIPRNRLTSHLNSRDFFWTERYPTATFMLQQVIQRGSMYRVTGELTLRGVTRPLSFDATMTESAGERRVTSSLTIDRQDWGIEYRFDPIRNEIVDDEIALVLELVFSAAR
jgi:polyisoprenoid-binding protein YceI